jgi:geranylgeranyl diphosphate synthase, type I
VSLVRAQGNRSAETSSVPAIAVVRARVDDALHSFLHRERARLEAVHADGMVLVEEITRLVDAGGKRVRPAFCYWGYRAAGGADGAPIVRAAASLELLHVFALVHDDVMDRSEIRRGVASTHARFRDEAGDAGVLREQAAHLGMSTAILVGDLAAVLADRLFLASGFSEPELVAAARVGSSARVDMALGQLLDITRRGADEELAALVARTKTGGYTIGAPLAIGATLGRGSPEVLGALAGYAEPLGEAFQIRDDLAALADPDESLAGPTLLMARAASGLSPEERAGLAEADPGELAALLESSGVVREARSHCDELVSRAVAALDGASLAGGAADALRELAGAVAEI